MCTASRIEEPPGESWGRVSGWGVDLIGRVFCVNCDFQSKIAGQKAMIYLVSARRGVYLMIRWTEKRQKISG